MLSAGKVDGLRPDGIRPQLHRAARRQFQLETAHFRKPATRPAPQAASPLAAGNPRQERAFRPPSHAECARACRAFRACGQRAEAGRARARHDAPDVAPVVPHAAQALPVVFQQVVQRKDRCFLEQAGSPPPTPRPHRLRVREGGPSRVYQNGKFRHASGPRQSDGAVRRQGSGWVQRCRFGPHPANAKRGRERILSRSVLMDGTTGSPRPAQLLAPRPRYRQRRIRLSGSATRSHFGGLPRASGGIAPIRALPPMWRAVPCDASTACAAASAAWHWVVTATGDAITPGFCPATSPKGRQGDAGHHSGASSRQHQLFSYQSAGRHWPQCRFFPPSLPDRRARQTPPWRRTGSDGGRSVEPPASHGVSPKPCPVRSGRRSPTALGPHEMTECRMRTHSPSSARSEIPP